MVLVSVGHYTSLVPHVNNPGIIFKNIVLKTYSISSYTE